MGAPIDGVLEARNMYGMRLLEQHKVPANDMSLLNAIASDLARDFLVVHNDNLVARLTHTHGLSTRQHINQRWSEALVLIEDPSRGYLPVRAIISG
jgi:hypothetical protein